MNRRNLGMECHPKLMHASVLASQGYLPSIYVAPSTFILLLRLLSLIQNFLNCFKWKIGPVHMRDN